MKSNDEPTIETFKDGEVRIKTEGKTYRRLPGWDWELLIYLRPRRWLNYVTSTSWKKVSGKNVLARLNKIMSTGQHTQGERE